MPVASIQAGSFRQLIADPSVARWQWQIMQMREQARIRQRDGIERRAVARSRAPLPDSPRSDWQGRASPPAA